MQTGTYLLTNLRSESKSINGIVPFGMRCIQCIMDGKQAFVA